MIIIVGSNRMMWLSSKVLMLECSFLYIGMRFFAPAISAGGREVSYSIQRLGITTRYPTHLVLAGQGGGICHLPKAHSATHNQAHTGCQKNALPLSPKRLQNGLESSARCRTNSAFGVQKVEIQSWNCAHKFFFPTWFFQLHRWNSTWRRSSCCIHSCMDNYMRGCTQLINIASVHRTKTYPVAGSVLYGVSDGMGSGNGRGLIERLLYRAA